MAAKRGWLARNPKDRILFFATTTGIELADLCAAGVGAKSSQVEIDMAKTWRRVVTLTSETNLVNNHVVCVSRATATARPNAEESWEKVRVFSFFSPEASLMTEESP
jgi:hypothetical protein